MVWKLTPKIKTAVIRTNMGQAGCKLTIVFRTEKIKYNNTLTYSYLCYV